MNPIDPAGFQGWSVGEAIEALVPRSVLEAWRAAKQRLEDLPTSSGSSFMDIGLRDAAAADASLSARLIVAKRGEGEARERVFRVLKELGFRGSIVGVGRPDKDSALQEVIERDRWLGFSEFNERQSIVAHDHGGFLSVVVYPLLVSPLASEAVAGRRLSDILCDFVLRDPEVEALFEVQPPLPGSLCDFVGHAGDGGCLVPVSDSVREIERALQNVPIEAVRSVLASRLAALGRLLLRDNLALIGFREGDEAEDEIEVSAGELRKPSLRLCLATGDFWQENASVSRRLYHAVRVKTREAGSADGAAEKQGRNKDGRPPSEDWKSAFNAVMARALKGSDLFTSAADLSQQMAEYATKHDLKVGKSDTERSAREWMKRHHPDIYGAVKSRSEE